MLERMTLDTFTPLLGQTFQLRLDDDTPIELVLESATKGVISGWQPPDRATVRQPFALTFLGPPQFVLPQRIYRVEHESLGQFEIFIVPIGRTAQSVSYEVVFS